MMAIAAEDSPPLQICPGIARGHNGHIPVGVAGSSFQPAIRAPGDRKPSCQDMGAASAQATHHVLAIKDVSAMPMVAEAPAADPKSHDAQAFSVPQPKTNMAEPISSLTTKATAQEWNHEVAEEVALQALLNRDKKKAENKARAKQNPKKRPSACTEAGNEELVAMPHGQTVSKKPFKAGSPALPDMAAFPIDYKGGRIYLSKAQKRFRVYTEKGNNYSEKSAAWGGPTPTTESWLRALKHIDEIYP